ncbi:MAG TPA: hypothetical protein VLA13_01775 [Massilibacterium sp.]|nr:hypothetical protein [Massilibacterium sp.]
MKKLLFSLLAIIFIGCATTLPPAGPTNEKIDGADKILLTVDESPDEAYQHFAQHLSDEGFGFENTDKTLMVIKTDNKESDKLNFSYSINASVRDNEKTVIQVSGNATNPMLGDFEIRNRGASGSLVKVSWQEMLDIAKSYPHQKIMYKRN